MSVYELLTGTEAFPSLPGEKPGDVKILDRVRNTELDYTSAEFMAISSRGQSSISLLLDHVHLISSQLYHIGRAFIKRLLFKDPKERPNAIEALQDNVSFIT